MQSKLGTFIGFIVNIAFREQKNVIKSNMIFAHLNVFNVKFISMHLEPHLKFNFISKNKISIQKFGITMLDVELNSIIS